MELLTTVTQNCFGIQIIFYGDEDESYPNDHAGHLIVEFEQGTVQDDAILLEILNNLLQYRQLILDIWSHFHPVVSRVPLQSRFSQVSLKCFYHKLNIFTRHWQPTLTTGIFVTM